MNKAVDGDHYGEIDKAFEQYKERVNGDYGSSDFWACVNFYAGYAAASPQWVAEFDDEELKYLRVAVGRDIKRNKRTLAKLRPNEGEFDSIAEYKNQKIAFAKRLLDKLNHTEVNDVRTM